MIKKILNKAFIIMVQNELEKKSNYIITNNLKFQVGVNHC
jgi:hypothetical protein